MIQCRSVVNCQRVFTGSFPRVTVNLFLNVQAEETGENDDSVLSESLKAVQGKKSAVWPVVVGIMVLAGIVFAEVFVWKRKEKNEEKIGRVQIGGINKEK